MTLINQIMELAKPLNAVKYRHYLEYLPQFELEEKLRILEAEQDKESIGWLKGRYAQLTLKATEPVKEEGRMKIEDAAGPANCYRMQDSTFPDLGAILRGRATGVVIR